MSRNTKGYDMRGSGGRLVEGCDSKVSLLARLNNTEKGQGSINAQG